jgi:hypothetical protein
LQVLWCTNSADDLYWFASGAGFAFAGIVLSAHTELMMKGGLDATMEM